MAFWTLLLIYAATFVLSEILRPKGSIQNAKPGAVEPPTAEPGGPVPIVFGTCKVSCNVVWFGTPHATPITRKVRTGLFSTKRVVTGYEYIIPMATVICHGPIDELQDIWFGDFSMKKFAVYHNPDQDPDVATPDLPWLRATYGDNVDVSVFAPDLFGGSTFEGGVEGDIEIYFGTQTQPATTYFDEYDDTYTTENFPVPTSPWRGISYVVWREVTIGNSPYLKPIFFIVRRCPAALTDATVANIEGDANPAEVIFEILTNVTWGLGIPDNFIDDDSFLAAAITLKEEGTGFSLAFTAQQNGYDMIQEVLRHCNGVLFEHPLTGLITLKLVRNDYNVAALPIFSPTNSSDIEFSRSHWRETYNEFKITYVRRELDFQPDVAQAQNLASVQAIGETRSIQHDFPGISRKEQAQRQVELLMKEGSLTLAKATFVTNRAAAGLVLGDPIVLSLPDDGIDELVMRISKINYGRLDEGQIAITVVEDIFDISGVAYGAPPPWTS